MPSEHLEGQLLPKHLALPIFASDPLSSVAYAPQELLYGRRSRPIPGQDRRGEPVRPRPIQRKPLTPAAVEAENRAAAANKSPAIGAPPAVSRPSASRRRKRK